MTAGPGENPGAGCVYGGAALSCDAGARALRVQAGTFECGRAAGGDRRWLYKGVQPGSVGAGRPLWRCDSPQKEDS